MKPQESPMIAVAAAMYAAYCAGVGGRAFNGDPLPSWEDFRADPLKEKQSDAWIAAAVAGTNQVLSVKDTSGAGMIAEERLRQLAVLGRSPIGDDLYLEAELGRAAECYLSTSNTQVVKNILELPPCFIHKPWPWSREWWKPSNDPVRNLVRAGALIAAEIDRILRKREREKSEQGKGS